MTVWECKMSLSLRCKTNGYVYNILSSLLFLATSAASTIIERKEISCDLIFFSFLHIPITRIRLLCPTMPKDTDFKDII